MENPLLVYRRKFDIRVFALITYTSNFEKMDGTIRGWFYEEGYIRTSCKEFNLQNGGDNAFMHLTNDAV
jgi:tubulin--tyrosine ligase